MAAVGLTGEDDAFELRVGQQFVRHDTHGQHRAVGRHGMGHRRHGGGLHQRCWMFAGAGNARGPGPPGLVDPGMGGLRFVCRALSDGGRCLVGEFGHRPPVVDLRAAGFAWGAAATARFRGAGRAAAWPNRSPAGTSAAAIGTTACRCGTLAAMAASNPAAVGTDARASIGTPWAFAGSRSITVSLVSKVVPRRA